jgi:hypothetical protein
MRISGKIMALFSDNRTTKYISDSSSGEEEPLIRNQNKIISYGAQERCSSGVSLLYRFLG